MTNQDSGGAVPRTYCTKHMDPRAQQGLCGYCSVPHPPPDALFRTEALANGLSKNLHLQLRPSPRIPLKGREMPGPGSRPLSWRQLVMRVMNTGPLPQSKTTLRGHPSFRDPLWKCEAFVVTTTKFNFSLCPMPGHSSPHVFILRTHR